MTLKLNQIKVLKNKIKFMIKEANPSIIENLRKIYLIKAGNRLIIKNIRIIYQILAVNYKILRSKKIRFNKAANQSR